MPPARLGDVQTSADLLPIDPDQPPASGTAEKFSPFQGLEAGHIFSMDGGRRARHD
jgi:hypothetical protein